MADQGAFSSGTDRVRITAKRVDSDAAEEIRIELNAPDTDLGKRTQLTDLVAERYPDAELRSFANDAASFLAPKVLIVAVYEFGQAEPHVPDTRQPQLFDVS